MPFVKRTDTKHHQAGDDASKLFIGRTNEIFFFVNYILTPEEPSYNIISISGQGGVGKTTLLTRFIDKARTTDFKDYCHIALVDERQSTFVSILEEFAQQLQIKGRFERALMRYREALRKQQAEREATQETIFKTIKAVTDSLAKKIITDPRVKGMPIVGDLLKRGPEIVADDQQDETKFRQLLKDARELESPTRELTRAFVAELNALAERQVVLSSDNSRRNQRIILCFDTFEQLAPEAVPWLLDYFLEMDISSNVVLVIVGRYSIERSTPHDPKKWLPYIDLGTIYLMSLESFTEEETQEFLIKRGITDLNRIETIWRLSRGLPLYLGMLTSNSQGNIDPTSDVVDNFLRWIPETEQAKRRLALDAALFSRPFNQDDLQAFSYLPQSENERVALYYWLIDLPFVRPSEYDGRYRYHEVVQSLCSQYLYQHFSMEYYATRKALVEYYRRALEKVHIEGEQTRPASAEWVEVVFALAEQLFLLPDEVNHIQAIEHILHAYEQVESSEDVIKGLRKLTQKVFDGWMDTPRITERLVVGLSEYIESDPSSQPESVLRAADNLLEEVAQQSAFSAKAQASIHRKRGIANQSLGEYQLAFDDFDQAIRLDPNNADYYHNRGNAYYDLKDYQHAILDFKQALDLDSNLALAHRGLNLAQQGLQNTL